MNPPTDAQLAAARQVLADFQLEEIEPPRALAECRRTSLLLVGKNAAGNSFVLKHYLPHAEGEVLPAGVRPNDYAWRETGFYRLLDSVDPNRREVPAPRTVAIGPGEPPAWLLLELLPAAVGPKEEVVGQDHVMALLGKLAAVPTDRLVGRRGFPVAHWDPVAYLERVRTMYDSVLLVIGESRWRSVQSFFAEALRWTESRDHVLVHGEFLEDNIVVTADGEPHLVDFENLGIGNRDHDFAWFWIHSDRHPEWKRQLLARWFGSAVGGDRIRTEWGMRSAIAYLALRRLHWSFLVHGDEDPRLGQNLALLDAALAGGAELFPA
ncbi:MAG: aminoglycoside phosphotransferase family protein [bacterium]|nr:aminoglycoside phosphotransferase family protein [bacterium]